MSGIIVGVILSVAVGLIVIGVLNINYVCYGRRVLWKIIITTILILCIVVGAVIGGYVVHTASQEYIGEYTSVKTTIEDSLTFDNLTGFERAALVTKAAEYNGNLAKYKVKCSKWYGFVLTDEILDLEYIDLSGIDG